MQALLRKSNGLAPYQSFKAFNGLSIIRATLYGRPNLSCGIPRYASSITSSTNGLKKKPSRIRWLLYVGVFGTGFYAYDNYFNSSIITRSVRTIYNLMFISIDYKWNFEEGKDIEALHERSAERLYNLLTKNKGLYIKIGQMIAIQGGMFPINYQVKFRQLFDSAPEDTWAEAESVLKSDLGKDYMKYFETFEQTPIASASIAQVHKATLKTGEPVAVKIQHSNVSNQVDVDLFTYKQLMRIYEYMFDMPIGSTIDYVCKKMKEEVDFTIEKSNGELISKNIQADKDFEDSVYIPKYYDNVSSKKVLTAEWIEGETLTKFKELSKEGYNIRLLSKEIITCLARQIFTWGIVHCDPHPGNLIVRKLPSGKQQLVILDHGLYEIFDGKFRREFAEFWKASLELDSKKMREVLTEWGLKGEDMMMAFSSSDPSTTKHFKEQKEKMQNMTFFERQKLMKENMKEFFQNRDKFPLSILFVLRSLRILQGINKNFGSPVNRMELLADEARKSILVFEKAETINVNQLKLMQRSLYFLIFKLLSSVRFYYHQVKEIVFSVVFPSYKVLGLEEEYEKQMMERSKEMGYDVQPIDDVL